MGSGDRGVEKASKDWELLSWFKVKQLQASSELCFKTKKLGFLMVFCA